MNSEHIPCKRHGAPAGSSTSGCAMWAVACGQSLAPWLIPIRDHGLLVDFRPILHVDYMWTTCRVLNVQRWGRTGWNLMPSPLVKENLKATILAMTSVVRSTSSPVALVRRTLAPRLTPAETQLHELATPAVATPTLAPIQPQCCACVVSRFHTSWGRITLRLRRLAEFLLH